MRTVGEWSKTAQDDWPEIAQVRWIEGWIEDGTRDLRDNHMEFDNKGNDKEIEKVVVDKPKPVGVLCTF